MNLARVLLLLLMPISLSAQDAMEERLTLIAELEIPARYQEYLEQDAYTECDLKMMEEILLAKINAYRKLNGLNELLIEDTACTVARDLCERLTSQKWLDHDLDGTTPSSRMQEAYVRKVWAIENLNKWGCTLRPESCDELTDYILFAWMTSKGHNQGLLEKGEYAAVGMYMRFNESHNYQDMVTAFNILYFKR